MTTKTGLTYVLTPSQVESENVSHMIVNWTELESHAAILPKSTVSEYCHTKISIGHSTVDTVASLHLNTCKQTILSITSSSYTYYVIEYPPHTMYQF